MMEEINEKNDKVEELKELWKDQLKNLDERRISHIAALLVDDISNYNFDYSTNASKFKVLGNKFVELAKNLKDDEIAISADVFWLHEQMMKSFKMEAREQEAFSMIFETMDDERTRDISLLNEFLASRWIMKQWDVLGKPLQDQIFSEVNYKNIRNFMNGALLHESLSFNNIGSGVNCSLILHKCVDEKLIFLLDLFLPLVQSLSNNQLEEVLKYKDVNGNNIFHLACDRRIKFVVEEVWSAIQRVFADGEDLKKINEYILLKNNDDKNAFQLAFQMPFSYNNTDFANEIKAKENLLYFYRVRGPLELEMYNFESCLNFIYDIARRNVNEKNKKTLIFDYRSKKGNHHQVYNYSKDFSGFRHDFLQLRYYCICKISSVKTENAARASHAYFFLSHYVENFMSTQDEDGLLEIYQKLSFDFCMAEFFEVFIRNYFGQALKIITRVENLKLLFEVTKSSLKENDFNRTLMERGFNGNNALQCAIETGDMEKFKLTFEQIQGRASVISLMQMRNTDGYNTLNMAIFNRNSTSMLNVFFEFFSNKMNEADLMKIFEGSTKQNQKFLDACMMMYDRNTFNLILNFLDAHLSIENYKKLIGDTLIAIAVSKWQESATVTALNLIDNFFTEEGEIKKLLRTLNYEKQTAFHAASKNNNLNQLQTLCKFAHAFLSKEDFIELITHVDTNEFSM